MRVYLAGAQPTWPELAGHHLLVSFAEPRQLRIINDVTWEPAGVLLDSGAFTVWKQGASVDLGAYIEFIQAYRSALDGYFALDVIQGSAEENLANLDQMEAAGLHKWGKLIPVFHEGDDPQYLAELVGRGYPTIGLGGTVSRGRPELQEWLLPIFEEYPEQGFHGLAMTQKRLIKHFPFRSVDSSSWLNLQRYGVDANVYQLKGLSPKAARLIGAIALEDIPRCPADVEATIGGQLRLFKTTEAG